MKFADYAYTVIGIVFVVATAIAGFYAKHKVDIDKIKTKNVVVGGALDTIGKLATWTVSEMATTDLSGDQKKVKAVQAIADTLANGDIKGISEDVIKGAVQDAYDKTQAPQPTPVQTATAVTPATQAVQWGEVTTDGTK